MNAANTTSKKTEDVAELRNEIETLRKRLADTAAERVSSAMGAANEGVHRAVELGKAAGDELQGLTGQMRDFVEKRPLQAALIAFALGALIGSRGRR